MRQPGGELAVLKVLSTTGQREDNDLDEPDLAEHPENEPRPNQQEELGGIDHSVPVASAATS